MEKSMKRLKKVALWRVCSISLTLLTVWIISGNLQEATFLTVLLHLVLFISHWIFESTWDYFVK